MSTRIRLRRMGRNKRPFYRIVVVDSRKPRDGEYIESLGYYNPLAQPAEVNIDEGKVVSWLDKGASPSDTVLSLFKKAGILTKRHEDRKRTALLKSLANEEDTSETPESKEEKSAEEETSEAPESKE